MKTESKISGYILRTGAAALLFSCVVIVLSSAINLPHPPPKVPTPENDTAFGLNGHETPTPTPTPDQLLSDSPDVTLAPTPTPTPAMTFTVTNANDSGGGSLRQAIIDANANSGLDMISFNIPGGGVHTITLLSQSPFITDPVIIDGYTQPGASENTNPITMGTNAVLRIQVNGNNQGTGLVLGANSGGSTIRGLVLNEFSTAIFIQLSSNSTIAGNFIGTDPTGTIARSNGTIGVDIFSGSANITLGGTAPAARNLISGNSNLGVRTFNAVNSVVQGNFIGTNAAGNAALVNGSAIQVSSGSGGTLIGGDIEASRNVIGGNGISIGGVSGITIRGNFFNTDVTGTARLFVPGQAQAIDMGSVSGITIGGVTGTPGMPPGNLIVGGSPANLGSAISGSSMSNITIQGNMIGLDITGTTSLGGGRGIVFLTGGTTGMIGGTIPGTGNVIAGHADAGIYNGCGCSQAAAWAILGNSIHSNGGLGIDLSPPGVPPNDHCDVNYPQNFPVITSASFGGGQVTISGTLDSLPSMTFRLEFFSSAQGDPFGYGEGQTFLGAVNRPTDASCIATFGPISFPVPAGQGVITATATRLDASLNPVETSEFSDFFASISGTVLYCSNPVPGPVPNVTLTLTGTTSGSTLSNASGNYMFSSLPSSGSYAVTPAKAARMPGSANINTVDVIAVQRHFLNLGTPLSGCRLAAADVNGDAAINTVDVIAIQRFFLGLSTGIANVGRYQFTPTSRSYSPLNGTQTAQNYNTLVFGDTAASFVEP